jgi:hypothetical protein
MDSENILASGNIDSLLADAAPDASMIVAWAPALTLAYAGSI